MSRALPPLNALRAFEAAGRFESFSRAAVELNVSHSAISRHVRGLEDRLGTQLFADAAPGVVLTAEGRAYLARVTPALDAIAEATEAVAEAPEGQVVVNSDPSFAMNIVAPALGAFASAHPGIELRLEASNLLADLDRYEADLAIRFAHKGDLDRPSDLISAAPVFPYAAPGYLAAPYELSDILFARKLRDRGDGSIWQQWAAAAGWAGPEITVPKWRMRAHLAIEAAAGGHGVYLGASDAVNAHCRRGRLVRLSETGIVDGAYRLVSQEAALRRKPVRIVREWLLDLSRPFRAGPFWEVDQPIG